MIRVIAKRYAKALLELSEEKKIADQVRADFSTFAGVVESNSQIQRLFASPAVAPEAKKAVIGELSDKLKLQPTSRRFIEHLAETGRIRYVREVHAAYEELLAERQNRAVARLTTASPLNNGDLADIKNKLEGVTGKKVDIDSKVDPTLIGGIKAQIGSVIYDGTIKNQMNKLREQLVR